MENNKRESVYSVKLRAGRRRTYFFDVRESRNSDYYITITESTRRDDGEGFKRSIVYLYKEDFNRFQKSLDNVINYVKTELLPDYDYDYFENKEQDWLASQENESNKDDGNSSQDDTAEDMSW